ncbi:hypothetical protein EMCRGX_G007241 [Ephydatia muelleri]
MNNLEIHFECVSTPLLPPLHPHLTLRDETIMPFVFQHLKNPSVQLWRRAISPWRLSPTIPRAIVLILSSQAIDTPDAFNHVLNSIRGVSMMQHGHFTSLQLDAMNHWMLPLRHLEVKLLMATGSNDDLQAHLIPNLEDLDQRIEIGRGSYGAVYEVKLNGLLCIAKGLHQIVLGMGGYERVGGKEVETIRAKFLQECSLLSKLKHPNIVQFLGIHRTKVDVLLVMECMHMDLAKFLKTHPDIPLPLKLSILLDVSYGLLHLHSQTPPIIYCDLTAANVLLTEGLRAKIVDLGVSKIFILQQIQQAPQTAAPGTQAYMPPEASSPTPQYDTKLDAFSFGVLSL